MKILTEFMFTTQVRDLFCVFLHSCYITFLVFWIQALNQYHPNATFVQHIHSPAGVQWPYSNALSSGRSIDGAIRTCTFAWPINHFGSKSRDHEMTKNKRMPIHRSVMRDDPLPWSVVERPVLWFRSTSPIRQSYTHDRHQDGFRL